MLLTLSKYRDGKERDILFIENINMSDKTMSYTTFTFDVFKMKYKNTIIFQLRTLKFKLRYEKWLR